MIKNLKTIILLALLTFVINCQFAGPGLGIIYTDTRYNQYTNPEIIIKKKGESCMVSYLWLFSIGDASINKIIQDTGINRVSLIENHVEHFIMGIPYYRYCTVVYGDTIDLSSHHSTTNTAPKK